MLKNSIKILTIIALFILFVSCFNVVYAYNIKFEAKRIEDNDLDGIFYRIYETPTTSTSNWYTNSYKKYNDGWTYMSGNGLNGDYYNQEEMVLRSNGSGGYILPGGGTNSETYRQWSTIFHPNVNTDYIGGSAVSYVTYTSSSEAIEESIIRGRFYSPPKVVGYASINGETYGYKGLYDAPFVDGNTGSLYSGYNENESGAKNGIYEILNTKDSLLRTRVVNNILISDRYINKNQVSQLRSMFSETLNQDRDGDGYRDEYIYMSNVNYSDHRDKSTTRTMDTAYKFYRYKSLLRGYGEGSVINTYDNILYMPRSSQITVYIRHIDVTDIISSTKPLNLETINNLASITALERVGYVTKNYYNTNVPEQITHTQDGEAGGKNAERYVFNNFDLGDNQYLKTYSKTDANYKLVGTVKAQGDTLSEAVENRDNKYNAMSSINELTDTYEETVDIYKQDRDQYVVIDYLYSRNETNSGVGGQRRRFTRKTYPSC